ncbi:Hypothetical predicted protein [Lecanosticta acicola]|uniref:Uncharacterized protein n=1 Tax=Lecanosticta acicola TaxID=111012 RepID=A0AAI9EDG9_9PEZI|nr:Hypothetical predicted protein [Lecanosticta acicola]
MSSLTRPPTIPSGGETATNSETAIGGEGGTNIAPKDTETLAQAGKDPKSGSISASQPGSAEAAAEKLFEERMEEEYAKREGGA